jgi:Na+(H+)/acetate symporter ActP
VAGGAVFALLLPLLISLLWGRLWKAGAIAGVALALLLHVTAAVALVYGIYWVMERFASAGEGASPSPQANLEATDTSEGMYLPAE